MAMIDIARETVRQAAKGDIGAFEEIYKAASGFVYNVAWRVTGNKEDAEEVAQNVFVTVYKKLATFRFESSLKTWLYRIAINLALNHVKRVRRERDRTVSYDDQRTHPETDFAQAAAPVQEPVDPERIEKMLEVLNPDQRACIVLRSVEGMSYQEIAQTLNININTVRSRIKRARETLLALRDKGVIQGVTS